MKDKMGASHSQSSAVVERDERRKGAHHQPPSDSEAIAVEREEDRKQLPAANLEAILREADTPVDQSSPEKLIAQLYSGLLLNQKKKKYWLDKKSNKNCFMVFARDLQITWAQEPAYWAWKPQQDTTTSDVMIDVAELLRVCWLEVRGRLDTRKLSPETLYEVVFVVMMKQGTYGLEGPVSIRLILPTGIKHEHQVNLMKQPRGQWMEIPIGQFNTVAATKNNNNNNNNTAAAGEIEFSLHGYDGTQWKSGLVIKCAAIRPKN